MSLEKPFSNNEKITNEWDPRHDLCIMIAVTLLFFYQEDQKLNFIAAFAENSILSDF